MKKIYCVVITFIFGFSTGVNALEVDGVFIDDNQITWIKDKGKSNKPIKKPKEIGPSQHSTQPEMMSSVVTTNWKADLNFKIHAYSRETWYGYSVGALALPGWMYEGYTYSLVLKGGYGGGVPDTSRVEIIMCVNWDNPLETCRTLRDDSDDYTPQHDAVSFSGFPVVTPSSQIVYLVRVLEHIGPFQPYPFPEPLEVTISSKLYLQP
ncbi:MAG: hypothetical protein H7A01_10500 [Hahellaceae bacterium]|jgi:hypothetical protein|nr:hypothetical protein [Hahellaceae bacterium]MCP5211090.1 hypothetical protein [Hahellaceae bacterium]